MSRATVVETGDGGHIQVTQRQYRGRRYETIIVNTGHHVYSLPDERVSDYDPHGHRFVYNEDDPDTRYDHDFSLSPDGRWLFVTRKLFNRVNVGYLYRLSGRRAVRVRPQGLRFDEAAVEFFTRHLHLPYPTIDDGARVIRFQQWAQGRLIFTLGISKSYERASYGITGWYGLRSGRFGLISRSED